MTIRCDVQKIGDLLANRVPFEVPKYQRAYAWGEDEIHDFIEDISSLMVQRSTGGHPTAMHFFGGIVTEDAPSASTPSGRIHYVVDGQQRLATLFMTLCCAVRGLRALVAECKAAGDTANEQAAATAIDDIEDGFLFYRAGTGGTRRQVLRLILSGADRNFAEKLWTGSTHTRSRDSHDKLILAFNTLYKRLAESVVTASSPLSDRISGLRAAADTITEGCEVIHITSDNSDEALRLFTVLNDRGRPLSDGDLLRAKTLEMAEPFPSIQKDIERLWDSILAMSDKDVDKFLRAYYPAHLGVRAPSVDLFDAYRSQFFAFSQPLSPSDAAALKSRVESLQQDADVFAKLMEFDWPYDPPTASQWDQDRLEKLLGVLKHELCIPLLLSGASRLPESQFAELVHLLERFAFRYKNVCNGHAGPPAAKYYAFAKTLRGGGTYSLASFASDLQALTAGSASDTSFSERLRAIEYSKSAPARRLILYFLTTVNEYLPDLRRARSTPVQPQKLAVYDLRQMHIEHIYPQTAKGKAKKASLEAVKHGLGNLTYWSPTDNTSAKNDEYAKKRKKYKGSGVQLNNELAKSATWTPAAIEKRRERLVADALRVFAF